MNLARRDFVRLGIGAAAYVPGRRLLAQDVSSHTAKALPRPAPSGRPFDAHLVDIAASAGLKAPVTYGGLETHRYIVESTGCGCAFIDYDNDGWMDLFVLCGTRLEGAPEGATNRLYKNNRDGTFTDVTEKAGLRSIGWASGVCVGDYNNLMMVSTISFALVLDRTLSTAIRGMGWHRQPSGELCWHDRFTKLKRLGAFAP
jgi:enediyne biosynthesis protein E4